MQISVRLHSALREKLPAEAKGRATLTLPDGATVHNLLTHFQLQNNVVGISVNDDLEIEASHPLHDGDHVEFFRVVGGG
ncbi:MAG TPA: MoaD/ThiS family protein [Anaerolineales bacterium]|nr:MoaD/ThiS family protein [Anaerolineales bacterium]